MKKQIIKIVENHGYECPVICSPEELEGGQSIMQSCSHAIPPTLLPSFLDSREADQLHNLF
jgi:hypothetical protein